MTARTLIAIPVYNEAAHVVAVLEQVGARLVAEAVLRPVAVRGVVRGVGAHGIAADLSRSPPRPARPRRADYVPAVSIVTLDTGGGGNGGDDDAAFIEALRLRAADALERA